MKEYKDMNNHSDCKNCIPFDVFKGFCKKNNRLVLIDSPVCENFSGAAKCRNCACFANPNSDEIGTCKGLAKEYWAYGDMYAKTCEGYSIK
jgi:4-hydroxyphenylacetate decarboxylase small subunit